MLSFLSHYVKIIYYIIVNNRSVYYVRLHTIITQSYIVYIRHYAILFLLWSFFLLLL